MDAKLRRIIVDYQTAVRVAVALLRDAGVPRPESSAAWVSADVPGQGDIPGGGRYWKHGFGVCVRTETFVVDFDFGAAGEIDGFDAGRLWQFVERNDVDSGFLTEGTLKATFDDEVARGAFRHSGYILYYLVADA